jgi:hypothetical protein
MRHVIVIDMGTSNSPARSAKLISLLRSIHPLLAFLAVLVLGAASAGAKHFYGTVESFKDGALVVRTTDRSTDHSRVDGSTLVSGKIERFDWVSIEIETSGHARSVKVEEHATSHVGVIKEIKGDVLYVRSGNDTLNWNLKETTILTDISRDDLKPGDEIGAKLYKNRNMAEVRLIKSGVK